MQFEHVLHLFSDNESPTFTYSPENQVLITNPMEYAVTAKWNMPTAVDNSGENPTVTCDHDSPSQFRVGSTVIMCTAVDESENEAVCSFTINVIIGEDEPRTKSNRDVGLGCAFMPGGYINCQLKMNFPFV